MRGRDYATSFHLWHVTRLLLEDPVFYHHAADHIRLPNMELNWISFHSIS